MGGVTANGSGEPPDPDVIDVDPTRRYICVTSLNPLLKFHCFLHCSCESRTSNFFFPFFGLIIDMKFFDYSTRRYWEKEHSRLHLFLHFNFLIGKCFIFL